MPDSGRRHHYTTGDTRPPCLHTNGRRKLAYRSPAKARHAAKSYASRFKNVGMARPYECGRCGLWHLTTHGRA